MKGNGCGRHAGLLMAEAAWRDQTPFEAMSHCPPVGPVNKPVGCCGYLSWQEIRQGEKR